MIELDEDMKEIWRRLIEVDPHFFPNWNIIARKSSPDEEIKINDHLCYNARINGDSCNLLLENEILKQKICGYNIPILSYFIKKQISLSELISKKINFR